MEKTKRSNGSEQANRKLKEPVKYTGTLYGFAYNPHPQGFSNYAIMTAKIEDGIVTEVSNEGQWAEFEAKVRMELLHEKKLEEMARHYPPGYRKAV